MCQTSYKLLLRHNLLWHLLVLLELHGQALAFDVLCPYFRRPIWLRTQPHLTCKLVAVLSVCRTKFLPIYSQFAEFMFSFRESCHLTSCHAHTCHNIVLTKIIVKCTTHVGSTTSPHTCPLTIVT